MPDGLKDIQVPEYSTALTTKENNNSPEWFTLWNGSAKGVNALNKAVNTINASFPFSFAVTATPSGTDEAWGYAWKSPAQGGGLRLVRDGAVNQWWFDAPSFRVGLSGDDTSYIEPFVDDGAGALALNPLITPPSDQAITVVDHTAFGNLTTTTTLATTTITTKAGVVRMSYNNSMLFAQEALANAFVIEFLIDGSIVAIFGEYLDLITTTPIRQYRASANYEWDFTAIAAGSHTFAVRFYYGTAYTVTRGSTNQQLNVGVGQMTVQNFY